MGKRAGKDENFRKLRRLVALVRRFRREGSGDVRRGYPEPVQRLSMELLESGQYSPEAIGQATGVSTTAVRNWRAGRGGRRSRGARAAGRFSRIRVQADRGSTDQVDLREPGTSGYVIDGPGGICIRGLGLDEVVALFQKLTANGGRRAA